jgi:hypothetical protein
MARLLVLENVVISRFNHHFNDHRNGEKQISLATEALAPLRYHAAYAASYS